VRVLRTVFLFAILLPIACFAGESLTVAVASNFQATAKELAAAFTSATGVPVRISAGSTGKLFAQIVNGAPYDVFLAADSLRPRLLEESGAARRGSRVSYANGALVLWSADQSLAGQDCLQALKTGSYRRLGIANPLTAPYGLAAKEFLLASGLYDAAQERIVYGENISQALQFVVTGNATLGLIAMSQVKEGLPLESTCSWNVPQAMHSVINQQAVVLSASRKVETARRFMKFLRSAPVAGILENHGYKVPE